MVKYEVLDKGYIEVVGVLGSDLTIISAAKLSYDAIPGQLLSEKDKALIRYLIRHQHTSPFRHAYVQLKIKMPEAVSRHIIKHMIGAGFVDTPWNEKSGRYKEYDDFYQPDVWRAQATDSKQGSAGPMEHQEEVAREYADLIAHAQATSKRFVELGMAKEMARLVLPYSTYTEVFYTASLQTLLHLIKLRDAPDAQWETQQYAKVIKQILDESFPETMRAVEELGNGF